MSAIKRIIQKYQNNKSIQKGSKDSPSDETLGPRTASTRRGLSWCSAVLDGFRNCGFQTMKQRKKYLRSPASKDITLQLKKT